MSGEVLMENLPKSIQVIFEKNPNLSELIPNPRLISNSLFISAFSQKLSYLAKGNEDEYFYRLVFKKGSSRELMTINSGELEGLPTTTCIEKGKISDVAGLEKVELDNQLDLMPALLGISLYSSIQNSLSYISDLCIDIRKHQIIEEQARFERISETIVDSFRSIPDISLDRSMRDIYLSRIVKNNDDCYELYISQRLRFSDLLNSKQNIFSTGCNFYYTDSNTNQKFHPGQFFEREVLTHPVFAVFERLVAGKICEIVISGNYSDNNIQRYRDFVTRIKNELDKLMEYRIDAFDNFTDEQKQEIEQNKSLDGYQLDGLRVQLKQHTDFINRINGKLFVLLESKLESFNILSYLMEQDEIDVFLVNGKLIVNDIHLSSDKVLQYSSN